MNDYRIIVQVEGGAGGSGSKTKPSKPNEVSQRGSSSVLVKAKNLLNNPITGAARILIPGAAALIAAGMIAKGVTDEVIGITAKLTGNYGAQMAWNNGCQILNSVLHPITTVKGAVNAGITEQNTNKEVSYKRELYAINDFEKGV